MEFFVYLSHNIVQVMQYLMWRVTGNSGQDRSGMGAYAGAAHRRVPLSTVLLRPPSSHRLGRRQPRQQHGKLEPRYRNVHENVHPGTYMPQMYFRCSMSSQVCPIDVLYRPRKSRLAIDGSLQQCGIIPPIGSAGTDFNY